MNAQTWFRPRLKTLVAEAAAAGYAQDVAVAVITDLMNGPLSSAGPAPTDEEWNRDAGEPDGAVHGAPSADPAQGPRYGGPVQNPLDHLGHAWGTTRPR